MTDKLPTIDIKGKEYVLVKDRVAYFNEKYPNGMIQTKVEQIERGLWISEAIVTPDYTKPSRFFTGHSQAREDQSMINKTAAAENCETSSVGRALALMGIGVVESIASADEVVKAITQAPTTKAILANAQAKRESGMTLDHVCLEHNVQMKERKSPAGGTYYDHRKTNEAGEWERCSGYGFKGDGKPVAPQPEGITQEDDIAAHGGEVELSLSEAEAINADIPF